MSSVVKGIAAIRNAETPKPRVPWLSLKDGDSLTVRFLQEFDEDSPGYNPDAGLAIYTVEWRDPHNFRKRILDTTEEEGRCWPAEQRKMQFESGMDKSDSELWKPRRSVYINVLVEGAGPNGEDEVRLLNQGFGPKSIVNQLLDFAEETGSITSTKWRFKRKGSGQFDTEYSLTPIGTYDDPVPVDDLDLVDFEVVLNRVPYAEQQEFFRGSETDEDSESSDDSIWG
jgi:hypothetical protein